MGQPGLPPRSSESYLWWAQGARDNQAENDQYMLTSALDVRKTLEALARLHATNKIVSERELVLELARIYAPDVLRKRYR